MVLGTWYRSSASTFTIAAAARGQDGDTAALFEGRLAHGLAPGEDVCDACVEREAELEGSPIPARTGDTET